MPPFTLTRYLIDSESKFSRLATFASSKLIKKGAHIYEIVENIIIKVDINSLFNFFFSIYFCYAN